MTINFIDIKEFREEGFLQELNRQFLHPLGMALGVDIDEFGNETLSGIWDYRNDPEGIRYDEDLVNSEIFKKKMQRVEVHQLARIKSRIETLGYVIQSPTN